MSVGQVMNVIASSQSATSYNWTYARTKGTGSNGLSLYAYSPYGVPNQACSVEANRTGQYRLLVSASNNCGSTAPQGTILITVQSSGGGQQLRAAAYPNPSNDSFTVKLKEEESKEPAEVSIFNKSMERVYFIRTEEKEIAISTSNFLPGLYYLNIAIGKDITQQQIVISH
jgi:hypothetical protein